MTRASARDEASRWAEDSSTVVELPYHDFNADAVSGGFAFLCDRGVVVVHFDGGKRWSIDPGDDAARRALVDETWDVAKHRNRPLSLADVSLLHRAAITALVHEARSVGALPPEQRPGVGDEDVPRADYLLIGIRRRARRPTESAALRAIASYDWLLAVPDEHQSTHACPLCSRPAIGGPRFDTLVCDDCHAKTVCSEGRTVTGYNTSLGGGFEARHVDDETVCEQVTRDGCCWIAGHEYEMGEKRFGGVYVIAARNRA